MQLCNGYPASEAILRGGNPSLVQITSAPFYYQPARFDAGCFDGASRYFFYTRRRDITLPAEIFRCDTRELTAELISGDEYNSLRGGGNCGTLITGDDKNLIFTINGETKTFPHGNARGPADGTRAYACMSPDGAHLMYYSNVCGPRHIFLMKFDV